MRYMTSVNKNSLLTNVIYLFLLIGFLYYQIIQVFLRGTEGIASSIYISTLLGVDHISVSTEPIYFFISSVLHAIGVPASLVVMLISQTIYGWLLYFK